MAVVQISKIQLRRGKKNSQSGIPQLSSAEMAWAIDTQELFIGNGSVAEGAPYVGNTKILTEHDNLLDLISGYRFANDDPSIINSVTRTLQGKLDEYVSIADYGAIGDGVTDCSNQIESAFSDLFRNVDETFRKTLIIPNGTYLISRDIEIPSNARIKGESKENSIILIGDNNIKLITENGTPISDFNSTDRPENIFISNLTIKRNRGQLIISGLRKGTFKDVAFVGEHFLGKPINDLSIESSAVYWENRFTGTTATDLYFEKCVFEQNSISVKCIQIIEAKSEVFFTDCYFLTNHTGIYIQGFPGQDNAWKIFNCNFKELEASAFRSTQGKNTLIESCRFVDCGNGTGDSGNPVTNIVFFGETKGNLVINSSFNRQQNIGGNDLSQALAIPEVFNANFVNIIDRINSQIFLTDNFRPLAVLSAFNKFIKIRYTLTINNHNRVGKITLILKNDQSFVGLSDDYVFSDESILSDGGILMENIQFLAELKNNSDPDDSSIINETVILSYRNPLSTGGTGEISFDVSYGV